MRFLKKLFIMLMLMGMTNYAEAKKALIVYFSHTGNTKLIADNVQEEMLGLGYEVDVGKIETQDIYPGYGDELRDRAKKEANDDNFRPALKDIKVNVQDYDLILVGSPVWRYKALPAVLAFLEKQNFSDKEVRFFITHGGGPGTCNKDMRKACKGAKFGSDVDVYCSSSGNGKVDSSDIGPWIKKVIKEIKKNIEKGEKTN